jgi:hypothetical protein
MSSSADAINVKSTVSEMKTRLQRIDEHIAAGRLPILKESTKQQLLIAAVEYERRTDGRLLTEPVHLRGRMTRKSHFLMTCEQ